MPIIKRLTKKKREYNQDQKEAYNNRQDIYKTEQWKSLRLAQLINQPLCECCLLDNKTTLAIDVHHLISFTQFTGTTKLYYAYDPNNLVSLCKTCHTHIHHNPNFKEKYTNLLTDSKIKGLEHP